MSSADAKRLVRAIRRSVPKRRRDELHGTVEYACGCGALMKVGLATGVHVAIENLLELPAPRVIECLFFDCDGRAELDEDSYDYLTAEPVVAYLRIPSRRASTAMVELGLVKAQLVLG